MSELQGRRWLFVRSALLPDHALLSREQKLRPEFEHSESEPHMKKRVVANVCAHVESVGGFNRSRVYFRSTCLYNEISGQAYQSLAYHRDVCLHSQCKTAQKPISIVS